MVATLAIYTSKGVAPEVNLGECIYLVCLTKVPLRLPTPALNPRGDVTRSWGYQWPQKWTSVHQIFKIYVIYTATMKCNPEM